MKKTRLILLFIFAIANISFADGKKSYIVAKIGGAMAEPVHENNFVDFIDLRDNSFYNSFSSYSNADTNFLTPSITAQYLYSVNKNIDIGAGAALELSRKHGRRYSSTFLLPHIIFKPKIQLNSYNLYILHNIGFTSSIFDNFYNKTKGMMYYAFGAGVEYNNLVFEFVYGVNKWKYEGSDIIDMYDGSYFKMQSDYEYTNTQRTYTFNIGYKFNL